MNTSLPELSIDAARRLVRASSTVNRMLSSVHRLLTLHMLVTPARVEAAHQAGVQVAPWTVNQEAEWDRLIAARVDAIITDDPAPLIGYLKGKGLRP